ncbi:MAG: hypothetical protein K0S37_2013 [Microbacterium sp.]|nr:hypothetical protein [Microbacterium sp.]
MSGKQPLRIRQGMVAGAGVGTSVLVVAAIRWRLSPLEICASAACVAGILVALYFIARAIDRKRGM